ncbi:MAG: hypothetical protein MUF81_19640 [Verrucomicrobia bacterium]|nr:hypothetical protein [Verrucomicrobiota bacterium]
MQDKRAHSWQTGLALLVYCLAMDVFFPLVLLLVTPVLLFKEKRRKTLLPRLGFQAYPDFPPDAPAPLWVHALSVGELLSCLPLLESLKPQLGVRPLVLSVSTFTAHQLAREKARAWVDHLLYFSFDTAFARNRCLRGIQPALVVLVETDIWPGFQRMLRRRGIPCLLVNGRLSPATLKACQRFAWLYRPALNSFARIHPQSPGEAERYRSVGVHSDRLGQVGNLKFEARLCHRTPEEARALRSALGFVAADPLIIAGSTHPGEEDMVLAAWQKLHARHPRLRLIVVPRHPHRGEAVATLFRNAGLRTRRYSEPITEHNQQVLVVDVLGVLASLYAAADLAFVGGSLVKKGGQNPIEPAAAGCPVLFGPDMSDFPDISKGLIHAGAAQMVDGPESLEKWLDTLLASSPRRAAMGNCGREWVRSQIGAKAAICSEIVTSLQIGARAPQIE